MALSAPASVMENAMVFNDSGLQRACGTRWMLVMRRVTGARPRRRARALLLDVKIAADPISG